MSDLTAVRHLPLLYKLWVRLRQQLGDHLYKMDAYTYYRHFPELSLFIATKENEFKKTFFSGQI